MQVAALTFRAEPEFIEAIRAYADNLGISANNAMRQLLAPAIGFAKKARRERPYCNPVISKLSGCLKGMDTASLWEGLAESSKIDEELWK